MDSPPERRDGVLCFGNVVFDILVRPVDRFAWNTTTWVEAIEQHMGGNGANTSCTLARLGVPVRLVSAVGRDAAGDQLAARLESAGVDLRLRRSDSPTATTVALVNSAGDRLFLHSPGAIADAFTGPLDLTPDLLEGISRLHLANPFALPGFRRHAGETARQARAAGLMVSIDAGWDALGRWIEDLGPCLPHADLLFVNEDEAMRLGGASDARASARRLRELGARVVVVKRGANGCAVFSEEGESAAPAYDVPVVDTTGAGDCFAGGFLAALGRGCSLPSAAQFANAVAALTIQRLGAAGGLQSYEQTRRRMESAKILAAPR